MPWLSKEQLESARNATPMCIIPYTVAVNGTHRLDKECDGTYTDHDLSTGSKSSLGRFRSDREAVEVWRGRLRAGVMDA